MSLVTRQRWNWLEGRWEDFEEVAGRGNAAPEILASSSDNISVLTERRARLFLPTGGRDEDGDLKGRRITMWIASVNVFHSQMVVLTGWVVGDGTYRADEALFRSDAPAEYAHAERWRFVPTVHSTTSRGGR